MDTLSAGLGTIALRMDEVVLVVVRLVLSVIVRPLF